jgi:hypothetical protein
MDAASQRDKIKPGMSVYGVDGELLGPVEAVEDDGIRVLTHSVPSAAIARVDDVGVHLHIAHAAFTAAAPATRAETDADASKAEPSS